MVTVKIIEQQLAEYRLLCEQYRKKRKYYQFFDLRNKNGIITAFWYGIYKDQTNTETNVVRTAHKRFNKSEIEKEIQIITDKLNTLNK